MNGGRKNELIITTAYFPYNTNEPPPKEMKDVTDYCSSRRKQLIIRCDANAHAYHVGKHLSLWNI
jgi:hypothetical protein